MKSPRKWKAGETSPKLTALVLTGGGARGAYQVGIAKYLTEQAIEFDLVCGTSIGGMNALLVAQGDIDQLEQLWCSTRSRDIYRLPSPWQLGNMLLGSGLGFLDVTPLQKLLRSIVNLKKLKESRTKLVLITSDLQTMETRAITTDDLCTSEEVVNAVLATSALPAIFEPRTLQGKGMWIDGGLVKNTPMQVAINMGAEEIYLALLNSDAVVPRPRNVLELLTQCQNLWLSASAMREIQIVNLYNWLLDEGANTGRKRVNIELFQPSGEMSHVLDIDPERSRKLIELGYNDVKKRLSSSRRKLASTVQGKR